MYVTVADYQFKSSCVQKGLKKKLFFYIKYLQDQCNGRSITNKY